MAHIRTIPAAQASGELAAVYGELAARPLPPVYRPPHGDAPGILLAHSLDPRLMRAVFATSGALHAAGPLSWPERELIATAVSRVNQCVY